jgi:hypothetical protein
MKRDISTLCSIYNASSCPWRLRTDHEHKRHLQRARIALRMIRRHFLEGIHYYELSSGALWPR